MRRRNFGIRIFTACMFVGLCCCIDPYNPSITSRDYNYLVVEAFHNATDKTCSVKLSRTVPLSESGMRYETGASVILEDDAGHEFILTELGQGEFRATNVNVDEDAKLTLKVTTQNGEYYESDAVSIYKAGAVDDIQWSETSNGVAIDVSAHNDAGTGYYYWQFTETWAYTSAFASILIDVGDTVEYRDHTDPDEAIYQCFMTQKSSSILIGSSDQLAQDVISNALLTTIPWRSPKMLIRYSILVEQRTIDLQAFEYWQLLKKNTEQLGTIFDPMPFLPLTNIRCVSSPGKIVLGYFNSSEVTQKRIFIRGQDLNFPTTPVTGYEDCSIVVKLFGEPRDEFLPVDFESITTPAGTTIDIGFRVAVPVCVDCRLKGGTNIKPVFWE